MPNDESQEALDRAAMIADIESVFAGVTRGRLGFSWSECEALDRYETAEECERARLADKDTNWRELVEDETWEPFSGMGGFCFINHEGFRYYLPPTMVRFACGNTYQLFDGQLLGTINRFTDEALGFWTQEQLRCIARFIEFMSRHDVDDDAKAEWERAIEERWKAHL